MAVIAFIFCGVVFLAMTLVINYLEIENFKSYYGKNILGPFHEVSHLFCSFPFLYTFFHSKLYKMNEKYKSNHSKSLFNIRKYTIGKWSRAHFLRTNHLILAYTTFYKNKTGGRVIIFVYGTRLFWAFFWALPKRTSHLNF